MANVVNIKRGLNISLKGKAPLTELERRPSDDYAVEPGCFAGIVPKVLVRVGDKVKIGTPLMWDKAHPEIRLVSPVSGQVTAVNRGEKRKVLSVVVRPDGSTDSEAFEVPQSPAAADADTLKALLLQTGMWPYIKQRPYDRVADPTVTPRDIFVSALDTAPLAPDFDYVVNGQEDSLQAGLSALTRLTTGRVYLGIRRGSSLRSMIGVNIVEIDGPHPAGNAGVIINHVKPVNKGETVWTLRAADVLFIGRLFTAGRIDFTRTVALTGSEMAERGYVKALAGSRIDSLIEGRLAPAAGRHLRVISGNVLTGRKVDPAAGWLGAYDTQVTAIPEGDDVNEFLGWGMPGLGKYSMSHSYFSWLLGRGREYTLDARIKGGRRAMIMSNEYDRVFPMDIFPEYLLKAIIAYDIDKMESLGIYEVAPEDFALCEFVDTSKIEIQKIVRNGLDMLYKEMN